MHYTSDYMDGEFVRLNGVTLPRSAMSEADCAIGLLGASLDRKIVHAADSDHAFGRIIHNVFLRDGEGSIGHIVVD